MPTRYAQTGSAPSPTAGGATELATTGAPVSSAAAAPPTAGQVATATSPTAWNWQTPAGGGSTVDGGSGGFPIALFKTEVRTCHHTFNEAAEDFLDSAASPLFTTQTGRRYGFRCLLFIAATNPPVGGPALEGQIIQEYFAIIKNTGGTASLVGAVTKVHALASGLGDGDAVLHAANFSGATFHWTFDWVGDETVDAVLTLQWNEMQV
jgi:hypothetical protein